MADVQQSNIQNQVDRLTSMNTDISEPFDGSTAPIVYMSDNRMPVLVEFNNIVIYIVFVTLVVALLFILPGVRRTKLTSFIGLLTILTMGASILLALEGTYWMTGNVQLLDAVYSSQSGHTITGTLGIHVGLSSANVSLFGELSTNSIKSAKSVDYNELFQWDHPDKMAKEHVDALRKGLPYPILTVTEFLSQDSDGFNWTRQLRQAGYYSSLTLYTALVSWSLMTIILCVLPVYLPHMMQITGALMIFSVWIYTLLIQSPKSIAFHFGQNQVEFAFGHTYVITFVSGALSMFSGVLLFVHQLNNPHEQFTIMDSEQYIKDQKALYSTNLKDNTNYFNKIIGSLTNSIKKEHPKTLTRGDSVIIPIADIEQNFKQHQ